MQQISDRAIADLLGQAAESPRRRSHRLLHAGPDDPVQRLLIALQPGTYIRPHRHSEQWEMLVLQRGRLGVLSFGGDGELLSRDELSVAAPVIQIPVSTWHGAVVLDPDTLVLEIKPGPYRPNEFAAWAPEENAADSARLVRWAETAGPGAAWRTPQ
jgi:cupin fold WbuC family metalloprotein